MACKTGTKDMVEAQASFSRLRDAVLPIFHDILQMHTCRTALVHEIACVHICENNKALGILVGHWRVVEMSCSPEEAGLEGEDESMCRCNLVLLTFCL